MAWELFDGKTCKVARFNTYNCSTPTPLAKAAHSQDKLLTKRGLNTRAEQGASTSAAVLHCHVPLCRATTGCDYPTGMSEPYPSTIQRCSTEGSMQKVHAQSDS
eukprot:1845390-Amphidinium_carterae.1